MSDPTSIFVDSDVFVASIKENDTNHEKVEQIFRKLEDTSVVFYTSNYVFSESITVISQRVDKSIAEKFIETIKSKEGAFSIIWVNEALEEAAIEVFKKQGSKNVSFVDCTNIAIVQAHYADMIFSFDNIYRKNRLRMVA